MNRPLVSVLMTAYNREKYIGEAIKSVLASTYSNFELIIVDDCSSDRTVEIASTYAATDQRIKVYKNEVNLGDYNNRNKAASYASGKYIKYLDSDDLIYLHGLDIMVSSLEKFPDAAIGFTSLVNQVDDPFPIKLQPQQAYYKHFFENGLLDCGPSAIIFRTDIFREFNGFSGKRYVGDIELILKIAAHYPVVIFNSSLVYWRKHPGQEMVNEINSIETLEARYWVIYNALCIDECPLNAEQRRSVINYYRKIATRGLISVFIKKKKPFQAIKMFKSLSLKPFDVFNAVFFINKRN